MERGGGERPVSDGCGTAAPVNYRIRGLYYVVDRLFTAAELRMGEKHQQVVRIVRGGPDARLDRSAR